MNGEGQKVTAVSALSGESLIVNLLFAIIFVYFSTIVKK